MGRSAGASLDLADLGGIFRGEGLWFDSNDKLKNNKSVFESQVRGL